VDLLAHRRRAAHLHAALRHERSAEFHRAVSIYLQTLGDEPDATWAGQLADDHRHSASQERIHASRADPDGRSSSFGSLEART
jgi:hypothetical protein